MAVIRRQKTKSLGAKGENNGSSYPLVAVHSRQKQQKTHTSEEWKTRETFPLLLTLQCCFPLWGQVKTLQSSSNKQLSLSLKVINP